MEFEMGEKLGAKFVNYGGREGRERELLGVKKE